MVKPRPESEKKSSELSQTAALLPFLSQSRKSCDFSEGRGEEGLRKRLIVAGRKLFQGVCVCAVCLCCNSLCIFLCVSHVCLAKVRISPCAKRQTQDTDTLCERMGVKNQHQHHLPLILQLLRWCVGGPGSADISRE